MKIAVYHDYLNQYGGAERVLEVLHELFPAMDVYTLVYDRERLPQYRQWRIRTSPVQCVPLARRWYQWFGWLFPLAVRFLRRGEYDAVIVSTHAWGNGFSKGRAKKIVYCHTPMRYFWDLFDVYQQQRFVEWPLRLMMKCVRPLVCWYDRRCAQNADIFIANSREVQKRIAACYGKEATVVYPPVNVRFFSAAMNVRREDYYLVVTRLKPYKRVDLIIDAFNMLGRRLIVVGEGPLAASLQKRAGGSIEFRAFVSDEELRTLYAGARGYVFMAHEDFGMSMAEAQAAGTPVIAYGRGGATEIVADGVTGVLFDEQSADALKNAVLRSDGIAWDRTVVQRSAERFSAEQFKRLLLALVVGAPGAVDEKDGQ